MKFTAAIVSALALGATAKDFSRQNDVVSLTCNFPSKWVEFHDLIGDAWDAICDGIDVMKHVALTAKYETEPSSGVFGEAKDLGKNKLSKRTLAARSNVTDLSKRGFVPGGQAFDITKQAICGIIKNNIPEVTCAHSDGAAFPC